MSHLVNFFYKIDLKLEKIKFLEAIKRAFIMMLPVFIIGAFSLMMMNFPISTVRNKIDGTFLYDIFNIIHFATYGLATLYVVFGITYRYSELFVKTNTLKIFYILNSFIVYFIFLGPSVVNDPVKVLKYFDVKNIFPALLTSLLAINLFRLIFKLITKGKKVPNHTFDTGIWSLLPMIVCIIVFGFFAIIFDRIPSIDNFNDIVLDLIARPFKHLGNSYGSGALLTSFESILWFFGIHGGNTLEDAKITVFELSSDKIISKTFLDTFVLMGGCGTLLSFAIATLIISKKQKNKKITYMSLGPMAFNINEITVFGIPIVLNPIYLIPFILTPFVSFSIAYIFMKTGMIPMVKHKVFWTTPILFSGYKATGSVWGSVLQLINLSVGVLIYIPFVKLDNSVSVKAKDRNVTMLTEYVKECEKRGERTHIFDLDPRLSRIAEDIATKIELDSNNGDIEMYYQPLYKDGKIYSLESLLRFKYNDKYLYPPLVINIAIEKDLFVLLSKAIVKRVLHDLNSFTDVNINVRASINLQYSLIADRAFMRWFYESIDLEKIPASSVGIEITEESSLPSDVNISKIFDDIRAHNIKIYLDDFSMGKTSITYLQSNKFDYVKLDGSLVKDLSNERSQDIVLSIVKLGNDLGFVVIAEYVETKEIADKLASLGCYIYQGYYYSKPLDQEKMIIKLQDDLALRHRETALENKNTEKETKKKETKKEEPVKTKTTKKTTNTKTKSTTDKVSKTTTKKNETKSNATKNSSGTNKITETKSKAKKTTSGSKSKK